MIALLAGAAGALIGGLVGAWAEGYLTEVEMGFARVTWRYTVVRWVLTLMAGALVAVVFAIGMTYVGAVLSRGL